MLTSLPARGRKGLCDLSGFILALGRMKGNRLTVFVLILLLGLLFSFIRGRQDPYFQKNRQNGNIQRNCLAAIV
jgi:hypothetical protein